jgi:dual specificity MAP kinase phosphatase
MGESGLHMQCIVVPHVFIGTAEGARNADLLKQHRIRRIITIMSHRLGSLSRSTMETIESDGIDRKFIQCRDEPICRLDFFLHRAVEWINESVNRSENVLVHCRVGRSRSATILIGYMYLQSLQPTISAAVSYITAKRKIVSINIGFARQLYVLEQLPLWIAKHRQVYFLILEFFNLNSLRSTSK